jgi:acyl carrier protein
LNDRKAIEHEVADIFLLKLHVEVPPFDSDLFETGTLDSLQFVELLFQLEQQFGVCIALDEADLENFCSIERITLMLSNQNGNSTRT